MTLRGMRIVLPKAAARLTEERAAVTLRGMRLVLQQAAARPKAARHVAPDPGRRRQALSLLAAAGLLAIAAPARAHEFRPAILEITSTGPGRFDVTWTPAPDMDRVQLVFPPACTREPPEGRRFVLDCGPPGLSGQPLSAAGLAPLRDEVLVRLREGGTETTAMLTAARPSFEAPAAGTSRSAQTASDAAAVSPPAAGSTLTALSTFAATGAAHFLTGPDHILFVIALLLLVFRPAAPGAAVSAPGTAHSAPDTAHSAPGAAVSTPGAAASAPGTASAAPGATSSAPGRAAALVRAITAFTLAHSLTLALQVLGAVRLPSAPVEAAIALSVLLLAREIARLPSAPPTPALTAPSAPAAPAPPATLTQRRPWLAAFAFGLLHGLGFAGGLSALHIPDSQIPAALLGFNVGLEAAQLALVAAALLAARALAPLAPRLPRWTSAAPAYAIGAAAAFWTLQRVAAFWA